MFSWGIGAEILKWNGCRSYLLLHIYRENVSIILTYKDKAVLFFLGVRNVPCFLRDNVVYNIWKQIEKWMYSPPPLILVHKRCRFNTILAITSLLLLQCKRRRKKWAFYHFYWKSLNFNLLRVSNCYLMLKNETHKLRNDSSILKEKIKHASDVNVNIHLIFTKGTIITQIHYSKS